MVVGLLVIFVTHFGVKGLMYEWSYAGVSQCKTLSFLIFLLQSLYLWFSNYMYFTWSINTMVSTNPKMQGGSTFLLMILHGCSPSLLSYINFFLNCLLPNNPPPHM